MSIGSKTRFEGVWAFILGLGDGNDSFLRRHPLTILFSTWFPAIASATSVLVWPEDSRAGRKTAIVLRLASNFLACGNRPRRPAALDQELERLTANSFISEKIRATVSREF